MALRAPRTRKTKAEVEQQLLQLTETVERAQNSDASKSALMEQIREGEVRAAVSEITVEVLSKKVSDLTVEISRTLSNLSEKMIREAELLASLKEAVALESKELERLHQIDIAAMGIDQLLSDYRQKRASCEAELAQLQQELSEQKKGQEQEEAEYKETLKKSRAREHEEYEYKRNLERKKVQDRFEEEWRLKEKQNRESQELLEKGWKEREGALKAREEEFLALKKESEHFSSRLATECAKSAKEAGKEAEAKHFQEIERLKRDLAVEKQIGELKIQQLNELLSTSQQQIGALHAQLDEAKRQVQDIAVKAIEGASGAKALNHINQIAMEQAKNRTQP